MAKPPAKKQETYFCKHMAEWEQDKVFKNCLRISWMKRLHFSQSLFSTMAWGTVKVMCTCVLGLGCHLAEPPSPACTALTEPTLTLKEHSNRKSQINTGRWPLKPKFLRSTRMQCFHTMSQFFFKVKENSKDMLFVSKAFLINVSKWTRWPNILPETTLLLQKETLWHKGPHEASIDHSLHFA